MEHDSGLSQRTECLKSALTSFALVPNVLLQINILWGVVVQLRPIEYIRFKRINNFSNSFIQILTVRHDSVRAPCHTYRAKVCASYPSSGRLEAKGTLSAEV